MSIEIIVNFDIENTRHLIGALQDLPSHLKPQYFNEEENVKSDKDQIFDSERFVKFLERNPLGFFLFSKSCRYNFYLYSQGYSELCCDLYGDGGADDVLRVFNAFLSGSPVFGFAAQNKERLPDSKGSYVITHDMVTSEYDHRNKHFATIGVNHIESGIGRDLDKYIPGIYWCTLLSDELLERHNINLLELSSEAISTDELGDDSMHLLKFYEKPEDWREHSERLDNICEKVDGIFSRRSVVKAVEGVTSYLEYDDIISSWR